MLLQVCRRPYARLASSGVHRSPRGASKDKRRNAPAYLVYCSRLVGARGQTESLMTTMLLISAVNQRKNLYGSLFPVDVSGPPHSTLWGRGTHDLSTGSSLFLSFAFVARFCRIVNGTVFSFLFDLGFYRRPLKVTPISIRINFCSSRKITKHRKKIGVLLKHD